MDKLLNFILKEHRKKRNLCNKINLEFLKCKVYLSKGKTK